MDIDRENAMSVFTRKLYSVFSDISVDSVPPSQLTTSGYGKVN